MATIVTLPTARTRRPLVATGWPKAPRTVTLLAMALAGLISLGTVSGVTDAFLADAPTATGYVASPTA